MLEVCFGDSVKGALSCAQHCKGVSDAPIAFISSDGKLSWLRRRKLQKQLEAERRELQKLAIPLGGTKDDLVGISFDFSMGDIASLLWGEDSPRKQLLFDWLTADPWGDIEEAEASARAYWEKCIEDLEKLKTRAATGEKVRIWVDETPSAACGMLFVADLLRECNCVITAVPLPRQYTRPDGIVVVPHGWGEMSPEMFGHFLTESRTISKQELCAWSLQWQALQEENAPLRAVQDGTVVSVPIDYYDDIIRQEFPAGRYKVAELIGRVLGRHQLGIGDWLVARRIQTMLDSGELRVVKADAKRFYNTIISR